uniref:hypothetical protein n=1 Tax=Drosera capensis TaxID=4366 RepID=UPI0024114490|nr:hypothetical protein P8577_pgp081 [Drosera capensis]WEQ03442.1 hypothetical protein [Drosera capensis]
MFEEEEFLSKWNNQLKQKWEAVWSRHWDSHWSSIWESLSASPYSYYHSKALIFHEFDVPPSIYAPNYYTYKQDLMAERMDKWLITQFQITRNIYQDLDQLHEIQHLSRHWNQYYYHQYKKYWFEYWYTFYAK